MRIKQRNPFAVLALSILTCGLYFYYLIYCMSEELKPYNVNDSMTPALELILCIVCMPYIVYWFYKYSKIITGVQRVSGAPYPEDNSIICLILPIFGLGVVSLMIMQANINEALVFAQKNDVQI